MRMFAIAIALMAATLGASAQGARKSSYKEVATGMLSVEDYALCVVKRHPEMARRAILANATSDTLRSSFAKLIIDDCAGEAGVSEISFPGDTYLYALAEALFKVDFLRSPSLMLRDVAALEHRERPKLDLGSIRAESVRGKQLTKWYEQSFAAWIMSRIGDCVARTDSHTSHALIASKPGTTDEQNDFEKLVPAISLCLPSGQKIAMGKVQLRGAIALGYVRLAETAAAKSPS